MCLQTSLQPGSKTGSRASSRAGSKAQLMAASNSLMPPSNHLGVPNGLEMKAMPGSKMSFGKTSQKTPGAKNKVAPVIEVEVGEN